ncbi:MAG: hypothetical protein PHD21_07560 [Flavobacteriales bacterium]|nr:hypothetical protein [Flavobacteriales bacterium]
MLALIIASSIVGLFFSPKTFAVAVLCAGVLWCVAVYPWVILLVLCALYFLNKIRKKQ